MMRGTSATRGIVHVHTELSFDGILQPATIAQKCRQRGLAFAAITDHAESMTEKLLDRLVTECAAQSGPDFVLIPGLEHRYKHGVHVLALGQSTWVTGSSAEAMLRALTVDGCVLVAAHCATPTDLPHEVIEMCTAVEIWNVARDTRLLPTTRQVQVYRKWAESYARLYAVGGLDMHKGTEWGCEVLLGSMCELTAASVLEELRAGRFSTTSRLFSFGSRLGGGRKIAFAAGDALVGVRNLRDRVLR